MNEMFRTRSGGGRAVAILAVAAVGCATWAATATAGVDKFDSKTTISRFLPLYHGKVKSAEDKCERGRRVALFETRPGRDRKVASDRTDSRGRWKVKVPAGQLEPQDRFYARARRKLNIVSGDGFVCRPDRSPTVVFVGD